MRYVLGINGGGSKTDALIVSEVGQVIGHSKIDGPSNERLVSAEGQREIISKAITGAMHNCHEETPLTFAAARISLLSDTSRIEELLDTPSLRVRFDSLEDCHAKEGGIAATGALGKRYDNYNVITIIADTGSVGWGHSQEGQELRIGGWGEALGDEGSGYSIALAGIRAAILGHDGIRQPTELTDRVKAFFGMSELDDLIKRHYRAPGIPRETYASFCTEVFAAARDGDEAASEILRHEAGYLAQLVNTLIRRLAMHDLPVYIVPSGSVWKGEGDFVKSFSNTLKTITPNASILKPRFEAVVGAAIESLIAIGIKVNDKVIHNLQTSLPDDLSNG